MIKKSKAQKSEVSAVGFLQQL